MAEEKKPIFPAATILILRDTDKGMESLMVRRHHKIDFASGAYVYPGGKIDSGDSDEKLGDFICHLRFYKFECFRTFIRFKRHHVNT